LVVDDTQKIASLKTVLKQEKFKKIKRQKLFEVTSMQTLSLSLSLSHTHTPVSCAVNEV